MKKLNMKHLTTLNILQTVYLKGLIQLPLCPVKAEAQSVKEGHTLLQTKKTSACWQNCGFETR